MEKWHAYFDQFIAGYAAETTYMHIFIKAAVAVAGTFIVWFILKGIINLFEKRIKKSGILHINTQTFLVIRKVLSYALVLVTGTYLIRLFNIQLIENIYHAILIVILASPVNELTNFL